MDVGLTEYPRLGEAEWQKHVAAATALRKEMVLYSAMMLDEELGLEALARGCGFGRPELTGYTALHYACEHDMPRFAAALVERRASLQAKTRDLVLNRVVVQAGGQTPLHLAARVGDKKMVALLLAGKANPVAVDWNGIRPALSAALSKMTDVAAQLVGAEKTWCVSNQACTEEALRIGALPSEEEVQALSKDIVVRNRRRMEKQYNVPENIRHPYTMPGMWTFEECDSVLASVQSALLRSEWGSVHDTVATQTAIHCSGLSIGPWIQSSLEDRLLPYLAARHGYLPRRSTCEDPTRATHCDGARLGFHDLFVSKYSSAPGMQRGLGEHRDASDLSFNILLNDPAEFEGGGTYIVADDTTHKIGRGDCFVHPGKLHHSSGPVSNGERYIVVGFLDVLDEDQWGAEGDMASREVHGKGDFGLDFSSQTLDVARA